MADKSKERMNLSAIKKVDPYAKEIVDSSSHVAFYTFNPDQSEWEKTDVEGAFFIYNRNGQPYYSIFINNRLNTTTFVEPITNNFELQLQPPFLLYRNERSRIRGYWFYNSKECKRIGDLVRTLIQKATCKMDSLVVGPSKTEDLDTNIFNLLEKASNNYQNSKKCNKPENHTSCNVLEFFAKTADVPVLHHYAANTFYVEQVESEQRSYRTNFQQGPNFLLKKSATDSFCLSSLKSEHKSTHNFKSAIESACGINDRKNLFENQQSYADKPIPPLLPSIINLSSYEEPLNRTQLVEAFKFLIQNDTEFVNKLHEAYLTTLKNEKKLFEM